MRPLAQAVMITPIGKVAVINSVDKVKKIDVHAESIPYQIAQPNSLTKLICQQLEAYFNGKLTKFDLPVQLDGTDFQFKVWSQLNHIPYGEALTYGELANQVSTSARAIGGACRHNPIPIVIPCHRVIAANGIGGYSGQWRLGVKVDVKRWLLQHEKKNKQINE
ncbi:methylated-DNA--[protein]-cysteine S-methyltransferase [Catenovulum sediminis]|uniref:Methylated-DNA--protein-cysteine methyltransferase n=1 Tax=Catenovulum sediminis TaxID=1740262 RepID=A0ABV1RDS6_9ALTE|nr:methylated-DNA--[protein]-cysteine S-methyltransferase [Catenovulum sediminis]